MIFAVVLCVYVLYGVFDIDIDAPINFNSLFATSALMKNFVLRFISLIVSNLFESCFRWLLAVFVFYRQWVPRWNRTNNDSHYIEVAAQATAVVVIDLISFGIPIFNSQAEITNRNFLLLFFSSTAVFFSLLYSLFHFHSVAVSVYLFVCTEKNSKQNRNERQT